MECKFAIKYGDKRSYLAKCIRVLLHLCRKPEVVKQLKSDWTTNW